MVFQDFEPISDGRKSPRCRKIHRRIAFVAISAVILIAIAGFSVITKEERDDETARDPVKQASGSDGKIFGSGGEEVEGKRKLARNEKFVMTMCGGTDYQGRCRESLQNEANTDPSSSITPKHLLKASIAAVSAELQKALENTKHLINNLQNGTANAAFEDCAALMLDAATELKNSIHKLGGQNSSTDPNTTTISTDSAADITNWLSAVMSYQQTCIDGFEDGGLRIEVGSAFDVARELTSNSLAMVSGLVGPAGGAARRVMTWTNRDWVGVPVWVSEGRWRMLEKRGNMKPDVVVAKDGSGNFRTIRGALAEMPLLYQGRYVIYIKKGVYHEHVTLPGRMANVTMYGDGYAKTIITGHKNFPDGTQTFRTASFAVMGDDFTAVAIGFRNTAGPRKLQAVAARVQADRAVFLGCRFEGFQDTLYAQTHRQFYRSCVITGTIDFIFGDAAAVFQNCKIIVRRPASGQMNTVTAHGRIDKHETTGFVLHGCHVTSEKSLAKVKGKFKSYLGRPWKDFARAIVMESKIDDIIEPEGWLSWRGKVLRSDKLYFGEYGNKGGGSKTDRRVTWRGYHRLDKNEAVQFTVDKFLQSGWVTARGAPVNPGLFN